MESNKAIIEEKILKTVNLADSDQCLALVWILLEKNNSAVKCAQILSCLSILNRLFTQFSFYDIKID